MSTQATSIPDTQLGLTSSEIQILRQHQQIALQGHAAQSRGRGTGRQSNSSSRAASAASSQGRLLLDPGSLAALNHHFEVLMRQIQARVEYLNEQVEHSVQASYDRAGNMVAGADAEIERMRNILAKIDEMETDFDKIRRIRDIVKGFRARVEGLDHRLNSLSAQRRR